MWRGREAAEQAAGVEAPRGGEDDQGPGGSVGSQGHKACPGQEGAKGLSNSVSVLALYFIMMIFC